MHNMQDTTPTQTPQPQPTLILPKTEDLTPKEVCQILKIGRSTINDWLKQGRVKGAYRVGKRKIRIPPSALTALITVLTKSDTASDSDPEILKLAPATHAQPHHAPHHAAHAICMPSHS